MGTSSPANACPAHARLFASPEVWMEGAAVAQFERVAAMPGCVRAAGMPDLHVGSGIPVGAAFAFADRVLPLMIGTDAGCGARLVATTAKPSSLDQLERRVRAALDDDPLSGCDPDELFAAVFQRGAAGLASVRGVPDALAEMASREPDDPAATGSFEAFLGRGFVDALGTAGGGNHFVEITRVAEVTDQAAAEALGLVKGRLCVLAHSGSRGLGGAVGRRWGDAVLQSASIEPFLQALAGARNFARANRFLLAHRMLAALGAARASKIAGTLDVVHNDVGREPVDGAEAWVHRKGAAPARAREATVVLGSRGAPSWVLAGTGHAEALSTVAHGAGRRMGRAEARDKLGRRYKRAELGRTALGSRVICDNPALAYEEHPDAYKPIEPVLASLLAAGVATPVASLVPLVTVKR